MNSKKLVINTKESRLLQEYIETGYRKIYMYAIFGLREVFGGYALDNS